MGNSFLDNVCSLDSSIDSLHSERRLKWEKIQEDRHFLSEKIPLGKSWNVVKVLKELQYANTIRRRRFKV